MCHTGKSKQHHDTLVNFLLVHQCSVHHLESFQLKLEPQLTQVGANSLFLPMVVAICLRRFEAGVNTFPHISHEIYFVNHLYLLNGEFHSVPRNHLLLDNVGHLLVNLLVNLLVDLHVNFLVQHQIILNHFMITSLTITMYIYQN